VKTARLWASTDTSASALIVSALLMIAERR